MIKLKSLLSENNLIYKLGLDAEENYSDMPVNWNETDVQITGKWDVTSIKDFLKLPRKYQAIYRAIVDINDLDVHLAERDPDLRDPEDPDEDGGYDWSEFSMRTKGFPPIVIRRTKDKRIHIVDGNHRVDWGQRVGYKTISAWVVDDVIQDEIEKMKKGKK